MATSAASSAAATLQDVAHAAEEFVDQLNTTEQGQEEQEEGDDADKEKSMEARKKKLELLRKKMASVISATVQWLQCGLTRPTEVFSASEPCFRY